jgi:hypothetical protein
MRRVWSYGAIVVGIALLILAPVVRWVVPGIAVLDPGEVNQQLFLRGTGDFFYVTADEQHLVHNAPIQVSRYITTACKNSDATKSKGTVDCPSGDVSTGKVGVWDQRVEYSATMPDGSVKSIQVDLDRVAFDRTNGKAVPGWAQPKDHGDAQVFFFPRNVKKQTYQFWDVADYHAEPATFVQETTYAGMHVYEFRQTPNRDLGSISADGTIPGKWLGRPTEPSVPAHKIYQNTRELFVEPTTGVILGESEDSTVTAQALDGRGTPAILLQVHNFTTAPESQNFLAGKAREAKKQLKLLTTTVPAGLFVLGVLALVFGIVTVNRQTKKNGSGGGGGAPVPWPAATAAAAPTRR